MKNIKNYNAEKYSKKGLFKKSDYKEIEKGIYEKVNGKDKVIVTSLSFVQETKLDEGKDSSDISQYPLEDVLDKFSCHVSDFYEELNSKATDTCYLEFGASKIDNIKKLRTIIGKHVYNSEEKQGDKTVVKLVIE